jgi:zinc protease
MTFDFDIPFNKFILDNGLTLIVHKDTKAPIVSVNIWYHVGSKNERKGRTGFAHLFEHLMFNGSENFDDDYFQAMERIGATDLNGTTNEDRTNYFQNVPTSALDVVLWLESDRMGHFSGALTQEKLDEQRGVVQNEKRQYENQPYGIVSEIIPPGTYPAGHPYSWSIIGSMEDLDAATLGDVKNWFRTFYGAANAVIAIAGDIDDQTALKKVSAYFGDIAPGPPIAKYQSWIAKRSGVQRQVVQDRVPQGRIYKIWNIPEWHAMDCDYLSLASDVLGHGKVSRLYKRLVYDEQLATDVTAYVDGKEIGGQFVIEATAKPGEDLARLEKAVDEELDKLLKRGVDEKELELAKTGQVAAFIRGVERIGGFGGKSDILAMNQVFANDPAYYKATLGRITSARKQDIVESANRWLSDGVYVLEVHPYPERKTATSSVDRSALPSAAKPPAAKFPRFVKTRLSNGLDVLVVSRRSVPIITFHLISDAGFAADSLAILGTNKLTTDMLDEGTASRTSLQIAEELASLGANLNTTASLDTSGVYLSALSQNLDASLTILADIVKNPSFPEKDFVRLKNHLLASIQKEKATPVQMALRVVPAILYGSQHAYGNPLTGSGSEKSVQRISRQDVVDFHAKWFKPNNSTLIIVGDTDVDEIAPKLETLFRNWDGGMPPVKNIDPVRLQEKPALYLVDRPDSLQSIIFAAHLVVPKFNPDEIAIEAINGILGGTFTSRINMNLRENKHWAYGAFSFIVDARGQRPFIAYAPVQTDKTKQAMMEIYREIREFIAAHPPTADELDKIKKALTLELPGHWEANYAINSSLVQMVRFGLPDDYFDTYSDRVNALTVEDLQVTSQKVLHPDHLAWIVVGDRTKIEGELEELSFGEIHYIDGDGNAVG